MGQKKALGVVSQRFEEIDLLRAIAIVLMIIFHSVYDLKEFVGVNIDYQAPFWLILGKISALLFIMVSGLACGFSTSPIRRGIKVLLYGMGITVVTFLIMKEEYVRFGILHFLGVAMILSPLLMKLSTRLLWLIAGLIAVLGFWFKTLVVSTSLFLPFGLMYAGFSTIDYYPLFPYLAVTIIGILAYRTFYAQRTIRIPQKSHIRAMERLKWHSPPWILWLSRNSLGIYLIHQPILLLFIYLLKILR
ncbi:putative membrane protein [Desulfosporosinus acidiphilus SJ4]|uniref:Putative membrane protein n=1 Tax=Desulfosporosinus acidiphilus (strain DSM 22704 / JCM 16185 / SJ4) TaxID=646529 RepID=I4DBN0_DESAJ|nr:heparan-alpha-glucosaminide N-acetyltransferase [Desulfosporosinus acidiphilus]AFM43204.1 putative membrane protein [Desulfosporosinus acidiphilus SJ4]